MFRINNIANDGNLKNELNEISKIVCETNEIGQNIIIKLSEQGDNLEKTEEKLNTNEFILSKTFRILRDMTWFGWILNFFIKDNSNQSNNYNLTKKNKNLEEIKEDNKEEKLKVTQEILSKNMSLDIDVREILNNENKELLFIESELKNLHSIGLKIGECIDDHNERLERISNKTEHISNKIIKNKDYISTIL
jgi:hypothetical protein